MAAFVSPSAVLVEELRAALGEELVRSAEFGDDLVLERFLVARGEDIEAAAVMWRESTRWRAQYVPRALGETGAFAEGVGGGDAACDDGAVLGSGRWSWRPGPGSTLRGRLAHRHGAAWLLDVTAEDGSPVALARPGAVDMDGIVREHLEEVLLMKQIAHLEDLLQTCRALSAQRSRGDNGQRPPHMVRVRAIYDLKNLSLIKTIRRIGLVKSTVNLGKRYYPEITASVTLINAPFGFETLWKLISTLLNAHIRAKVTIVGADYAQALRDHARIADTRALPKSLGGAAPDVEPPQPVPKGAGDALLKDPDPPFHTPQDITNAADAHAGQQIATPSQRKTELPVR